jgi:hypothetical protein
MRRMSCLIHINFDPFAKSILNNKSDATLNDGKAPGRWQARSARLNGNTASGGREPKSSQTRASRWLRAVENRSTVFEEFATRFASV